MRFVSHRNQRHGNSCLIYIHILSSNVTICSWKHLNSTMFVWAKVWLPILWSLRWPSFPMFSWDTWPRDPKNWPRMRAMIQGDIYPATSGRPSRLPSAFAGLRAPRHGAKVCPLGAKKSKLQPHLRWREQKTKSLDLPPLAFFPLSVLTCIIFVNLLSSRSVLFSSWSLLSSSPCPLFLGRLEMLGLTSKKDPTKRNLLMIETFGKGVSKCWSMSHFEPINKYTPWN